MLSAQTQIRTAAHSAIAEAVLHGLGAERKQLPSWLLYDAVGSALFDEITRLPEYYLTRAEAEIFERQSDELVLLAAAGTDALSFAELGAGHAVKTEALLAAAVRVQGSCVYLACDISEIPLRQAQRRLQSKLPEARVCLVVGTHLEAGPAIAALPARQVLLWIGSSIGNYTDADAASLLASMRRSLRADAVLVFGTDLVKDPATMQRAYDDEHRVTAAFSKNLLVRINRELDACFDASGFRHVAEWDAARSNVEVYLESTRSQRVWVGALERDFWFARGERIHTETCAKYDAQRVDGILTVAGFTRAATLLDSERRFAVHVARLSG